MKGAWGREKRISAGVSEELEEHRGLGSMLQEQVADTVERAEAVPGFNAETARTKVEGRGGVSLILVLRESLR